MSCHNVLSVKALFNHTKKEALHDGSTTQQCHGCLWLHGLQAGPDPDAEYRRCGGRVSGGVPPAVEAGGGGLGRGPRQGMAYPHNAEPLRGSAPVPPAEAGTFFRGDTGSGTAGGREPGAVGSGEPPAGKGPDGGASLLRRGVFGGGDQPTDAHSRRHGPNPAPPGPQAAERTSGRY